MFEVAKAAAIRAASVALTKFRDILSGQMTVFLDVVTDRLGKFWFVFPAFMPTIKTIKSITFGFGVIPNSFVLVAKDPDLINQKCRNSTKL